VHLPHDRGERCHDASDHCLAVAGPTIETRCGPERSTEHETKHPLARRRLKIPLSPLRVNRVEKGLVENESYGPTALGGENLSPFVLPHPLSEV